MPSHRPTSLGPDPLSGDGDEEAPTRSGFGQTGDEERTAVDDGGARSRIAATAFAVEDSWDNKPTRAGNVLGATLEAAELGDFSSVDGTGERTADGSSSLLDGSTSGKQPAAGKHLVRRATARPARATSPAAPTAGNSFANDSLTAPSTVVDDDSDRATDDDGAHPLPPLAVVPGAASASAAGAAPPAALLVVGGNDRGRRFALNKALLTVGRAVDNDVVLTDISVSRHHLAIAFDGKQFVARDLGSGNGTLINQRERAEAALAPGDQLELGNTLFRFEADLARGAAGRPVLELGDDQSTVAERPRGLRTENAREAGRVPHVSASALSSRSEALEPLGGAGSVSQIAIRPQSNNDREAPSTDSVLAAPRPAARERQGTDFSDRRLRRRIYLAAVLFGLVVALVVVGSGESNKDPASALVAEADAPTEREPSAAPAGSDDANNPARDGSTGARDDDNGDAETAAEVSNGLAPPSDDSDTDNAGDTDNGDDNGSGDDSDTDNAGDTDNGDSSPRPESRRAAKATPARRNGAKRDGRAGDRNRATRNAATPRTRPPERSNAAIDQAARLYQARNFSSAAKALRSAANSATAATAKKLKAQASAFEAVGKHLAAGDSSKRTNAPGAMMEYRKALSLDRKSGRGVHGTYIRLRLRDVAPRAAGAFMAQKRYEAAKRAADEAVTYGAGSDPMVKRVRAALSRKAGEYYRAGMASRSKNPKLAASNFKRAMSLVPKSDPLYGKARAALQR